jgi:hypothetical protein
MPGSMARVRVEWPSFIGALETYRHREDQDVTGIVAAFIERRVETAEAQTILEAASFPRHVTERVLETMKERRKQTAIAVFGGEK